MVKSTPGQKSGVYLLYGKEDFLKREFIQTLRREIFSSTQDSEMGYEQFEATEHSLGALADFLKNSSFFASRKMAVLYGIDELKAEPREALMTLVHILPADSTLVLVSSEFNVKKDPFLKALAEKVRAVGCNLPFDKDLPQWIESRMKKFGKAMDRDATILLIERIGKDAALLNASIEQLSLYANPEARILTKHVEALLGRSVQADAFRLIDLLLEKKLRSALENLETLLKEGAKIYEVIGALSGQTERLNRAQIMIGEGFPLETITAELRLHPFFANRFLEQAQKTPRGLFRDILKDLLECDEMVKTGQLNDRLALQRLFLKICLSCTKSLDKKKAT